MRIIAIAAVLVSVAMSAGAQCVQTLTSTGLHCASNFLTVAVPGAVPFITITDNSTNDPEVRLPDFAVAHSVVTITE